MEPELAVSIILVLLISVLVHNQIRRENRHWAPIYKQAMEAQILEDMEDAKIEDQIRDMMKVQEVIDTHVKKNLTKKLTVST